MSRNRGRIHVDYSPDTGAVIRCRECPEWTAWRWTREEAWESARAHEERAHPGARQAFAAIAAGKARKHAH